MMMISLIRVIYVCEKIGTWWIFNWDNIFVMCYVFSLVVRSMQKWPKKVHMFHPRHARQKIVGLR